MPTLVLVAGPNGTGKTTFINRFLRWRVEACRFVNLEEVARGLTGEGPVRDLTAGSFCWTAPLPTTDPDVAAC